MSLWFLIAALHLSRNSTAVGILPSILPGVAAASSTVPGTDRYPRRMAEDECTGML